MLAIIFFLLALGCSQELRIYSRPVGSSKESEFGRISFDAGSRTADFLLTAAPRNGSFCLGTRDLAGKECFAYQETAAALLGQFKIYVDDGSIDDVSFAASEEYSVAVVSAEKGPVPNLEPAIKPTVTQQPKTKKVVRRRLVENEAGETVEMEEEIEEVVEEDTRSWIQKNWMYVVPPLVLFLVMSPEQ